MDVVEGQEGAHSRTLAALEPGVHHAVDTRHHAVGDGVDGVLFGVESTLGIAEAKQGGRCGGEQRPRGGAETGGQQEGLDRDHADEVAPRLTQSAPRHGFVACGRGSP